MDPNATVSDSGLSALLKSQAQKDLLRFLTCGSVDDGKSTLIGRLLSDANHLSDDQRETLEAESRRHGKAGENEIDYALLMDGLSAEREQGITIDVAYRFFETDRRKFIVSDTPGHEQYTRNMATGASNADLAVLLVDARNGVRPQTRRHANIVALMGIESVVLAVNKMDAVGYDETVFRTIADTFEILAEELGLTGVVSIPVSALKGDNVINRSANMPWYNGPTLMKHLETVPMPDAASGAFRFPVQWVNRPDQNFRGFSGTVAGGKIAVGDRVSVLPAGQETTLAAIVTYDGDLGHASAGEAVTLVLADEVDVSRGNIIVAADDGDGGMGIVDQFQAHLIWMGDDPLVPGRDYGFRVGTASASATVMDIKYHLDIETQRRLAARTLDMNDVGVVTVSLNRPMPIDRFADNRDTGAFVLIDRFSNATVAAGTVDHPLRRATNVVWHDLEVDKGSRAAAKGQKPMCIWFTGLSGAGKSTIANLVDKQLAAMGRHAYVLDGDNVRHGLNKDLGFTEGDRVENIRRIAEVASLMVDAGLIVLVCAISPFRRDREMARALFGDGEFVEVFVDTPLAICEERDPKGLYRKARSGEIPNFTGISAPYEAPLSPDITLTPEDGVAALAAQVVERIDS